MLSMQQWLRLFCWPHLRLHSTTIKLLIVWVASKWPDDIFASRIWTFAELKISWELDSKKVKQNFPRAKQLASLMREAAAFSLTFWLVKNAQRFAALAFIRRKRQAARNYGVPPPEGCRAKTKGSALRAPRKTPPSRWRAVKFRREKAGGGCWRCGSQPANGVVIFCVQRYKSRLKAKKRAALLAWRWLHGIACAAAAAADSLSRFHPTKPNHPSTKSDESQLIIKHTHMYNGPWRRPQRLSQALFLRDRERFPRWPPPTTRVVITA